VTGTPHGAGGAPTRFTRLGVDVGDVRVGLARSDLDGLLATPVETLARPDAARRVAEAAAAEEARVIMVGLPRSLDGHEGPAAHKARSFCDELAPALDAVGSPAAIRLIDERLTTVSAHQALHTSGRRGKKHRSVVDQVAAVMILQQALDAERATGREAGETFVRTPAGADAPSAGTSPQDQETA